MAKMDRDFFFEVMTPLGFRVHVTETYWRVITELKHPIMRGREEEVKAALQNPSEIRVSKTDSHVYLFYKPERLERWVCAVAKRLNGEGFLITTYPTEAIKEGKRVWPK